MSHEFRTPLTSMTSITGILLSRLDGPLTDEQQKQVEFLRGSARELTEMVNDLLDLAKVEAGRITISPEWFEMVDLFSALRGMFKPIVIAQFRVAGVRRTAGRHQAVHRRQEALADPAQLHLECAQVHAAGRGARGGAAPGRRAGGVRRQRQRHRHRAGASSKTCSPTSSSSMCRCRSGCVVRGWASRWRGSSPSCWVDDVGVESELGKGSRFSVVLPVQVRGCRVTSVMPAAIAHQKILAVDDNPSSLYATVRVLRSAGFEVIEATTGNEALAKADESVALDDPRREHARHRRFRGMPPPARARNDHLSTGRAPDGFRGGPGGHHARPGSAGGDSISRTRWNR